MSWCDVITLSVGDEVPDSHPVHKFSEQSVFSWSPGSVSQGVRDKTLECLKTHECRPPGLRDRPGGRAEGQTDRQVEGQTDRQREVNSAVC